MTMAALRNAFSIANRIALPTRRSSRALGIQQKSANSIAESAKSSSRTSGVGRGEHPLGGPGHVEQDAPHPIGVGAVGHAHGHPDAQARRGPRVVDDLGGDERAVRDDHRHLVARDDVRGAQADVLDRPERAADANEVAVAHRLLEQEDDAADEVLRDVLEAEADADGEHGRRGEQRVEPEAHRVDGPEQADGRHRVADDLRHRELDALRRAARAEHAAHREREQVGDRERDEDDRRADQERPRRDRRAGDAEQLAVEEFLQIVRHARSTAQRSPGERDPVQIAAFGARQRA